MANIQKRVDTSSLFKGLIGQDEKLEQQKIEQQKFGELERELNGVSEKKEVTKGRKPNEEKLSQVSIYLTEREQKELRVQGALKEKEKDQSAIARMGIDIVLALSPEEYNDLKNEAASKNMEVSDIVKIAIKSYL